MGNVASWEICPGLGDIGGCKHIPIFSNTPHLSLAFLSVEDCKNSVMGWNGSNCAVPKRVSDGVIVPSMMKVERGNREP